MPYYYVCHMSGYVYSSDEMLSYEDLHCETCGDSDTFIGYYDTLEEAESAYYDEGGN